jgi:hypothetical protein
MASGKMPPYRLESARTLTSAGASLFETKTVFVLGAGTSVDFGFPSGATLLGQIRQSLDFKFDHMRPWPTQGDARIFEALKLHFKEQTNFESTNRIILAGHKLVQSSEHAISIDNAIDTLEDDDVAFAGKLGIASNILSAEAGFRKQLAGADDPRTLSFGSLSNSWLPMFLQLLTVDVRGSQIDNIFNKISFVNFNYDRVLDFALPEMLARHYSVGVESIQNIYKNLKMFRPYGRVGRLKWESGSEDVVEFGDQSASLIAKAASGLKTFTEQISDDNLLLAVKEELDSAERVVFLGFGYHRQNIKLLRRDRSRDGYILGTTFGITGPEVEVISRDLRAAMIHPSSSANSINLVNANCLNLLKSYGRLITS